MQDFSLKIPRNLDKSGVDKWTDSDGWIWAKTQIIKTIGPDLRQFNSFADQIDVKYKQTSVIYVKRGIS